MENTPARNLRFLMRELCTKALESAEGGEARRVAETALQLYPEECAAYQHASLVEQLAKIARDIFKEFQESPDDNGQMELPNFPSHYSRLLPVAIAIPRTGKTMVYKSLFGAHSATVEELRQGIAALRGQIQRDTARCEALEELLHYREYRGE